MKIALFRRPDTVHIIRMAKRFNELGHEVVLIYFKRKRDEIDYDLPELSKRGVKIVSAFEPLSANAATRLLRYLIRRFGGKIGEKFGEMVIHKQIAKSLDSILLDEKPDILLAYSIQFYGQILAYTNFQPTSIYIIGSDFYQQNPASISEYKRCLQKCTIIQGPHMQFFDDLKQIYDVDDSKFKVTIDGIDNEIFNYNKLSPKFEELKKKFGIPLNKKVILSPRSLSPIYNWEVLLQAFAKASSIHSKFHLYLLSGYTKNSNISKAKRLIKLNGLNDKVSLNSNFLSSYELAEINLISDFCVSIPKTDMLGYSIIECMVMKSLPILGELENYHYFYGDDAIYTKKDIPSLKMTFQNLPNLSSVDYKRMVENNYLKALKLDWRVTMKKTIEIYEDVVKSYKQTKNMNFTG